MRLHLMPDEKIINRTIDLFEDVYPNENKYIILLWNDNNVVKHVNRINSNIIFINLNDNKFGEIIGKVNEYESIIVHFLSTRSASFINKIEHPKIYWIEWGGDLYDTFLDYKDFKLYSNERFIFKLIYGNIPYFILKFIKKLKRRNLIKFLSKAVRKVRYFVPDSMYDEYPLFLKYYPEFTHLEYKEFFYYPIDEILGKDLIDETCQNNSIIVGNSSSFTGNHIEVLTKLKEIKTIENIVLPLSYAGNLKYRDAVINFGKESFGTKFLPITEYQTLENYNKILLNAGVFIYGNLRQEAVGNILIALYIGGKVFLDSRNPLLNFYRNLGLIIFSIDELTAESITLRLSASDIQINRKILLQQYSLIRLKELVQNNF